MASQFLSKLMVKFQGLFGKKTAPAAKSNPWLTRLAKPQDTRPGPGCIDVTGQKK